MKEVICKEDIGGGMFIHTIYKPIQDLVRCKDCKRFVKMTSRNACLLLNIVDLSPNWFCAAGERRSEDEI